MGSSAALKVILVLSLALNVAFIPFLLSLQEQNLSLREETRSLDAQVEALKAQVQALGEGNRNLSRQLAALQQEHELALSQLAYYKAQLEYYAQRPAAGNASGLVGNATVNIVAVRAVQQLTGEVTYEGVTMLADGELRPGGGRILIDTRPRVGIELQSSMRAAAVVAENLTGVSLASTDIILSVKAEREVDVVDGPSAGVAVTIALIAAVRHQAVPADVYMTGTVSPDGSIGPVGAVAEKALAAAQRGAKTFIVPRGQTEVVATRPEVIELFPGFSVTIYRQFWLNLPSYLRDQGYSVSVVEASTVKEAYDIALRAP